MGVMVDQVETEQLAQGATHFWNKHGCQGWLNRQDTWVDFQQTAWNVLFEQTLLWVGELLPGQTCRQCLLRCLTLGATPHLGASRQM